MGVPIVVSESVPDATTLVSLCVAVTPGTILLKRELKIFVLDGVNAVPVPGPVGVPIVVSVASVLPTLLVSTPESVEDAPARSLVTLPTMEVIPPTSEVSGSVVGTTVVVGGSVAPVPGPVTPDVNEVSLGAMVEASGVAVDPSEEVAASVELASETVEVPTVAEPVSVLSTSLVADSCEVSPVAAPVVTSDTTLLTADTTLLRSFGTVARRELTRFAVGTLVVVSADWVLSVETTIPLDVSDTAVVVGSVVVVDGVTIP